MAGHPLETLEDGIVDDGGVPFPTRVVRVRMRIAEVEEFPRWRGKTDLESAR
jgi:hypothetical protein